MSTDVNPIPTEPPVPSFNPVPSTQTAGQEESLVETITEAVESTEQVIRTSDDTDNGLSKCPRCGSSEIQYSMKTHMLVCEYCRYEWNEENAEEKYGLNTPINNLKGTTYGSGASDITTDETTLTLKCQGCGAEIIVNTANSMQSRCHWCRQTLSVNAQVPNGATPDAILPFTVTHEEAVEELQNFVKARTFFAQKKFLQEFTPENVVGVYLPYMIVDAHVTGMVRGKGEVLISQRTRTVGYGDNQRQETVYTADVYDVAREMTLEVDDLFIESSKARANMNVEDNTNNVINAVLPYDIKNAVKYNSNYLKGFTSEKRDLNMDDLNGEAENQLLSVIRAQGTNHAKQYDRGIRWEEEALDTHGSRWVTVYLPVWLYSSYENTGSKEFTHHIAVNGRNKRTMGSVPLNGFKLGLASTGIALATGAVTTPIAFFMFLGS